MGCTQELSKNKKKCCLENEINAVHIYDGISLSRKETQNRVIVETWMSLESVKQSGVSQEPNSAF